MSIKTKFIIITFLILSLFHKLSAQQIFFGAKVGANFATISGEDSDEYANPKFGWNVGGVFYLHMNDFFSFQTEISYSERGCYFEEVLAGTTKNTNWKYYYNYDYIEIPIMLKMEAGKTMKFGVMAGPVFSPLLSATKKGTITIMRQNQTTQTFVSKTNVDENIRDDVSGFDFGFLFGSGITITRSKQLKFLIDVRYYMGFTTLDKENPELDIRNEVVTITAGFVYCFNSEVGALKRDIDK